MIKGKNINTKLEVNDNLKVFLFRNNIAFGTTTLNQLKSQGIFGNQIAITSDTKVYCIYKNKADYLDFSFIQSNPELDIKVICYSPKVGYGYVDNSDVFTSAEPTLGYGLLYNWYAATDARGVAPSGFRIPSQSDINTLIANVTADSVKSTRNETDGEPNWNSGDEGTDASGFSALPAGIRSSTGPYSLFKNSFASWGEEVNTPDAYYVFINTSIIIQSANKSFGLSVRCVSETEPPTTLVQDADGNNYSWVQIGSQYWLQQSLKTTKFNNGDDIPSGFSNTDWANLTAAGWAYPNGNSSLPI